MPETNVSNNNDICGKATGIIDGIMRRCPLRPLHPGRCRPGDDRLIELKVYVRPDQKEWLDEEAAKRGGARMRNGVVKDAIDAAMVKGMVES